jgi:hypothetical protein
MVVPFKERMTHNVVERKLNNLKRMKTSTTAWRRQKPLILTVTITQK